MIERLYIRDLLSFEKVELEFAPGLIVLSGPSGAGKSVLMQALLSNFGFGVSDAKLCEVEIKKPDTFEGAGFDTDDYIAVKSLRRDRTSYYLDGQKIPRKILKDMFAPFIQYQSVRDRGGLQSALLIEMIDRSISVHDPSYVTVSGEYRERFRDFVRKSSELDRILKEERELSELIEYAHYEIDIITSIDPKEGEYEELMKVKRQLSRIDKINEALEYAGRIFDFEESVQELFSLLEKDGEYFSDTMNQLRADFEEAQNLSEDLSEIDIESVLNRLEKISDMIRRYGSAEEALLYREKKIKELEGYEHIERDRSDLENFLKEEKRQLQKLAKLISSRRKEEAAVIEKRLLPYLERLKLSPVEFSFCETEMSETGIDSLDLDMEHSDISTLSGGEFNRLRLALMSVTLEGTTVQEGVIFLDEIDANVSGDESIAIADMISKLSQIYQIFAISHQPHLSARADQHILVYKDNGKSFAKSLEKKERVKEIARIVSGERANDEALAFAEKLIAEQSGTGE